MKQETKNLVVIKLSDGKYLVRNVFEPIATSKLHLAGILDLSDPEDVEILEHEKQKLEVRGISYTIVPIEIREMA